MNRDEINTAFFNGKAELMHINHFHPTRPGWDPSWEQRYPEKYGYNPQRASELLAEAGLRPQQPVRDQHAPARDPGHRRPGRH